MANRELMVRNEHGDLVQRDPLPPRSFGKMMADKCFTPKLCKQNYPKWCEMVDKICSKIERVSPIESAFVSTGVPLSTYRAWKREYKKELKEFEDTPYTTYLIELFDEIYRAEKRCEERLGMVLFDKSVDEGDTDSAKFLLKHRFNWNEKRSVQVDTGEDAKIQLNIVPMVDKVEDKEE